jgi:cupin fold WbuC family metalloprotein
MMCGMNGVQLISGDLIAGVLKQALQSPRRRMNFNFHGTPDENPHRFLNVMLRGTYIPPHRHREPPKAEAFLVLEGEIVAFLFDDEGRVAARHELGGPHGRGIDIAPGVWHTVAVLTEHAICYEVKAGPYSAANDKEFAPWAPREGDPRASAYLASLLAGWRRLAHKPAGSCATGGATV